jgi:endonuclease YncB( thermonuclease family)
MSYCVILKKASLVGAFFVSMLMVTQALAFCPLASDLPSAAVQRVVDGDTLHLADGRRVRLIGLDTPELGRAGRPAEPGAVAARSRLRELVAASRGRVGLRLGREAQDRYGRTLAHVYDGRGRNLEAQMLDEGLGYRVAVAPNVALVDCQQAAERQARTARRGLWKQAPVQRSSALKRSGFALVQGRVEGVERNRGGLWLELEGSVVLRIKPEQVPQFDLAFVQGLVGRRVEARGWVLERSRRGARAGQARWLLPLSHPSMLELAP